MGVLSSLHIAPEAGGYEPYRIYDWLLEIYNLPTPNGLSTLKLSAVSGALPVVGFENISLPFGNDSVNVPGKATVEQGQFTFHDYVDPSTARVLDDWWLHHYNPVTGAQFKAKNFKKRGKIIKLPPADYNGDHQEGDTYGLIGVHIGSLDHGQIDYATSDALKIQVTFVIDRAVPLALIA